MANTIPFPALVTHIAGVGQFFLIGPSREQIGQYHDKHDDHDDGPHQFLLS